MAGREVHRIPDVTSVAVVVMIRERCPMSKWNFQAMGEVGLTGWRRQAAQSVAR